MADTDKVRITVPPRTPEALLREAARLIEQAVTQLDTASVQCKCCKLMLYRNVPHHKAFTNLHNVPGKLRREAEHLEKKTVSNSADDGARE